MTRLARIILCFSIVVSGSLISTGLFNGTLHAKVKNPWLPLETGLELGSFVAPIKSPAGDSIIQVLKIDPNHFNFRLTGTSFEKSSATRGAKEWARKNNLVATINASMFQRDNKTSVSLMKTHKQVNNTWVSKDKTIFAFDPKSPSLPKVQIIDRECQDFKKLRTQYRTLIQSIRMVSCKQENVWAQQSKISSIAAIGIDTFGHILFIHSRSPFSGHDFIANLLKLPIHLKRAMYTEGGPSAQLYVHSGNREFEFLGNFSSGKTPGGANKFAWPIPNVIGIQRIRNQ